MAFGMNIKNIVRKVNGAPDVHSISALRTLYGAADVRACFDKGLIESVGRGRSAGTRITQAGLDYLYGP